MATITYNEIKASMPDSLRMKLDHIKRYLDEDKAAAFIGAGFSKNARMPESAEMKDWNALGVDFYRRLYGSVTPEKLMFQNPISLATQVEACFGRNELDNLIEQSLPNDMIVPSKLHVDLLNLPWHDLFTTNYDTLLERACLDADRPYTVVVNKETLLYSISPRIIKLHGSFHNIRPYIITEEDFRTYPQNHPEFVNTVRQSLIENLFCMIGFSGEDPNFKSWLGWLRDVMGQQMAPVYLITYDRNLHDAKRSLCARQHIEILNLYDLHQDIGIQESFDFFFEYLRKEANTIWTGKLIANTSKIKKTEQVREITEEMKVLRQSYPGWLVLPKRYYDNFHDVRSDMMFWKNVPELEGLKPDELLRFLYEISWRLDISLTPIGIDWYIQAISDLSFDDDKNLSLIIDIKLSLLTYYRINGMEEKYAELRSLLNKCVGRLSTLQSRKFIYEQCLFASAKMQYDELNALLSNWTVYETDFVGALWKSSVLMELSQRNEAVNLLNRASYQIRTAILSSQKESYFLKSCQIAIERQLYMVKNEGIEYKKYMTCDYLEEMKYFKERLQNASLQDRTTKNHGYNVDDVRTSWNYGSSGFVNGYLYPYSYYSLCERVGMPIGLPDFTINSSDHGFYLPYFFEYNHYFPMGILIRSYNALLIDKVLDRKVMSTISSEHANQYFDEFYSFADQFRNTNETYFRSHLFNSCLPALSRLCSKASQDRVKKMAKLLLYFHTKYNMIEVKRERGYVKTVLMSLNMNSLIEVLSETFELPIQLSIHYNEDYYIPLGWADLISCSSTAVKHVIEGLSSTDETMQEAAFLRAYQVLRAHISEDDRAKLMEAVVKWRSNSSDIDNVTFSFIDTPLKDGETITPQDLLKKDMESLLSTDVIDIRNSAILEHISNTLHRINLAHVYFDTISPIDVLRFFVSFVTENENLLSRDDSKELFGGLKRRVNKIIEEFNDFLSFIDLSKVPEDLIAHLSESALYLGQCGLPYFTLAIRLERYSKDLNESKIKQQMLDMVLPSSNYAHIMDIVSAIIILSERHGNYQQIVHQMLSLCEYYHGQNASFWFFGLYILFKNKAIKSTSKPKFIHLIDTIYSNANYDIENVDIENDVRHAASILAGAMSKEWGEIEPMKRWHDMENEPCEEFNEVRFAYQRGFCHRHIS